MEGLTDELVARFQYYGRRPQQAMNHLLTSMRSYTRWHAYKKITAMQEEFAVQLADAISILTSGLGLKMMGAQMARTADMGAAGGMGLEADRISRMHRPFVPTIGTLVTVGAGSGSRRVLRVPVGSMLCPRKVQTATRISSSVLLCMRQRVAASKDNCRSLPSSAPCCWAAPTAVRLVIRPLARMIRTSLLLCHPKSTFLALVNMSHEIRTPMNGVIGGVELLLSDPSILTGEQKELLSIIKSTSEAMLTLINDILDLSKIEAGHVELDCSFFSVRDCVESTIDVLAQKASAKGIDLCSYVEPSVPAYLFSDPVRVKQILFNLLSNAVKFTHVGIVALKLSAKQLPCALVDSSRRASRAHSDSRATDGTPSHAATVASAHASTPLSSDARSLRHCTCHGSTSPQGRCAEPVWELHFEVIDTGIGIPQAAQSRLFSFAQGHRETNRLCGGTGLGLANTKLLVELLAGSNEFASAQ